MTIPLLFPFWWETWETGLCGRRRLGSCIEIAFLLPVWRWRGHERYLSLRIYLSIFLAGHHGFFEFCLMASRLR